MIECETSTEDGRLVWRLVGALDSYSAQEVRALLGAIGAGEDLVVDLTECTYVDTAGLWVLRERAIAAAAGAGSVVVRCDSARLRRVLEQTGFDRLVVVEKTPASRGRTKYQTDSSRRSRTTYGFEDGAATAG